MKKKMLVGVLFVIGFVLSGLVSAYATNYLYNSKEVSYDNAVSGLTSTSVEGAINELVDKTEDFNLMKSQVIDTVYPVGSIYTSVSDDTVAKVAARFGGTWEAFGAGRTLVGMGSNGTTNYQTVEDTGGVESVKLTAEQSGLPAHSHGFTNPAYSVTGGSHAHNVPGIAVGAVGSGRGHLYLQNDGNLVWYGSNGVAKWSTGNNTSVTANQRYVDLGSPNAATTTTSTEHTHTVTRTSNGSVSNNTKANASQAHTNMQPYITVYMYKRIS